LGIPLHRRRSMRRQPDWLCNNAKNQDERSCGRNPIVMNLK
jgi:hypothetical protein